DGRRRDVATCDSGGDEGEDLVHRAGGDEAGGQRAAAFCEYRRDAPLSQQLERTTYVDPAITIRNNRYFGATTFESAHAFGRSLLGHADQRPPRQSAGHQPRLPR